MLQMTPMQLILMLKINLLMQYKVLQTKLKVWQVKIKLKDLQFKTKLKVLQSNLKFKVL